MSLKHGLLGLLNYGQMTGYQLDKTFKASLYYFWPAQTSQIYRELNDMEQLEWLTSQIVFQTDKPNRKLYTITPLGKSELQNWLAESSLDKEFKVRSLFLLKLFFSGEKSIQDNLTTLNDYKNKCLEELASLNQTGGNINQYAANIDNTQDPIYWQLTARFGEMYFKMRLDFINEAIGTLEEML